jgi:hypothetical protein
LKTALTGGLHLSAARESGRGSGPAGVKWAAAVFGLRGKRTKKNKDKLGWAGKGWVRVGLFCFFSIPFLLFPFQTFTQNLFKIFKQTFDHTINQNPCIQHDAQTLGISKLINYHCIYLKANLIIQIH